MTALLAAAFAAGMVATVNPCGFAMLPAYLGLFIGDKAPTRRSAFKVGASVSIGFVLVFALSGLLVASGVRAIVGWIPWLAAVVGIGLIGVGAAQLRGLHLFARLPGVKRFSRDGSFVGLVGFGASYGVASLSCTLPIFLSLIAGVVAGRSFIESMWVFLAYGGGMSLVVIVLTISMAVGRDRLLRAIRPLAAHLGTVSGWVLILAGAFIVWYWATVLASAGANLGANPIVRVIERLTAGVAGLVSANPLLSAIAVAGLGLVGWLSNRRGRADAHDRNDKAAEVPGRIGS
ncbi:MAG: cytochrome c biogenesis protein CcdA [Actinobacteria bacterium]|nr:cytochrome c biogenesis protein CcdA [Actinomycetota bacterium]